jgi:hypothetical protein
MWASGHVRLAAQRAVLKALGTLQKHAFWRVACGKYLCVKVGFGRAGRTWLAPR